MAEASDFSLAAVAKRWLDSQHEAQKKLAEEAKKLIDQHLLGLPPMTLETVYGQWAGLELTESASQLLKSCSFPGWFGENIVIGRIVGYQDHVGFWFEPYATVLQAVSNGGYVQRCLVKWEHVATIRVYPLNQEPNPEAWRGLKPKEAQKRG